MFLIEERGMTSKADELEGVPPGTYCVWKPKAAESPPGRCRKNNSTGSSKRWKFYDFLHWSNNDGKDTFVFLTPRSNMKKKAEKEAPSGVRKPKPKSIAAKVILVGGQSWHKKWNQLRVHENNITFHIIIMFY